MNQAFCLLIWVKFVMFWLVSSASQLRFYEIVDANNHFNAIQKKKHICLIHFFPSVCICNNSACIRWENRLKAPFSILFKEAPSLFTRRNPHICIVALFVNHADIQKQIEWIFTYCHNHHSFKNLLVTVKSKGNILISIQDNFAKR